MPTHELARGTAETLSRVELQRAARSLGLPATGPTWRIALLLQAAISDPRTWSREAFDLLLPHLAVHQDVRGSGNVDAILHDGLARGMVDPAAGLEPGGREWTWAKGYLGSDAFIFLAGKLKYLGIGNPRLAEGNVPLFHARPAAGASLWTAIRDGAVTVLPRHAEIKNDGALGMLSDCASGMRPVTGGGSRYRERPVLLNSPLIRLIDKTS